MIAYLGNAFVVLLEGQASPRDKVSLHSLQVDNVLLARGTGYSAKWFLSKHSIILVILALLAEDHLEQSVDLTLQLRQPLVGLLLVGEPVQQAADEVAHASLKCIQIRLVGLGVQHLKDVGELVFSVPPQLVDLLLQTLKVKGGGGSVLLKIALYGNHLLLLRFRQVPYHVKEFRDVFGVLVQLRLMGSLHLLKHLNCREGGHLLQELVERVFHLLEVYPI